MPNIREYRNPIVGLEVSGARASAASTAGEAAGRGERERFGDISGAISRFGTTVAAVRQYEVQKEIAAGGRLYTGLLQKLTEEWNDTAAKADLNDNTIGATFAEKRIGPEFDKFLGAFTTDEGRLWADQQVQRGTQHFQDKLLADTSTRAGLALIDNLFRMNNSLAQTVAKDPSAMDVSISTLNNTVEATVANAQNLTPAVAAEVKTEVLRRMQSELVKTGLKAMIDANPEAGLRASENPKYAQYLNSGNIKEFAEYARTRKEIAHRDEERAFRLAEQEKKVRSDAREDDIFAALYSGDPAKMAQVTNKSIIDDDNLTKEAKQRLVRIVQAEAKPEARAEVSNQTAVDLYQRMALPDGHPAKITSLEPIVRARAEAKLNKDDFNWLEMEFREARTPDGRSLLEVRKDFENGIKASITKSNVLMGLDKEGDQDLYKYQHYVSRKIAEYRQEGKDPHSLFDPLKPDYLGKPEVLKNFQTNMQKSLARSVNRLRAGGGVGRAGQSVQPAPLAPKPAPKVDASRIKPTDFGVPADAKAAPDGKWYVEREVNGKKQFYTNPTWPKWRD